MPANLRSMPIQGHVTDSAGNVIRNGSITVKREGSTNSTVVAAVKSNNDGYFVTPPLPNGTYNIYESGILVSKIIHRPFSGVIPAFKASSDNYKPSTTTSMSDLIAAGTPLDFKAFIQIESSLLDVSTYGNSYPIYDVNLASCASDQLRSFCSKYHLSTESRITTTRFDVEYFSPLTSLEKAYKRIRWSGIPAIKYFNNSKLVIPLDYSSMIVSLARDYSSWISDGPSAVYASSVMTLSKSGDSEFDKLYYSFADGDVVQLSMLNSYHERVRWYGVFIGRSTNDAGLQSLSFVWLGAHRFSSAGMIRGTFTVESISRFDGMFNGLLTMDELIPDRITVTENVQSQNSSTEPYIY